MIRNVTRQQPLTRNGNPYKPTRLGTITGSAVGAAAAVKLIEKSGVMDKFIKGIMNTTMEAQGLKDIIKTSAKSFKIGAFVGFVVLMLASLGGLLGNSVIDAPKNQELRDQADGEKILERKKALGFQGRV